MTTSIFCAVLRSTVAVEPRVMSPRAFGDRGPLLLPLLLSRSWLAHDVRVDADHQRRERGDEDDREHAFHDISSSIERSAHCLSGARRDCSSPSR